MLLNYRFKPIAFTTLHSSYLDSTTKAYFRILFGRLKRHIVDNYDGKIKPYDNDETWFNLIINPKGITVDAVIKRVSGILSTCVVKEILQGKDIEFFEEKLIECEVSRKIQRGLNMYTIPLVIGSYISIYSNDLSSLIKHRIAYPGSYIIRAYLNDALQSFISKAATQFVNEKYSVNKIIKTIKVLDDLLKRTFEQIIALKKFFNDEKSDAYNLNSVYDFMIFVNTCNICDEIYSKIAYQNDTHSAQVYIAKTIRDAREDIEGKELFRLVYNLLINYFVYKHMFVDGYTNIVVEHRIYDEDRIYDIGNDRSNKSAREFLINIIEDLIQHTIIPKVLTNSNDSVYHLVEVK